MILIGRLHANHLTIIERIENVDVNGLHTICNADQSYQTIARLFEAAIYNTHLPTLAMAVSGVLGILIFQRFFPRLPAILSVAALSTAVSFLIDYQGMGGAIVSSINIEGLLVLNYQVLTLTLLELFLSMRLQYL